jgi:hypothetical protein
MFHLHETTRRRVCRTAFVALCVAPTVGTLSWIAHARRPWRVDDEQLRLSGLLHVDVHAADWRTPRPGVVATSHLRLGSAVGNNGLAELLDVTWRRGGASGEVAAVKAITLDTAQFAEIAGRLHTWIEAGADRSCQILIDRVAIHHAGGEIAFEQVRIHAERDAFGLAQLRMTASPAGSAADGGELRLAMNFSASTSDEASASDAGLAATIDASDVPLPAWLVAVNVPAFGDFGESATFSGTIHARVTGEHTSGSAQGVCNRVLLASNLPPHAAQHAEGEATVRIESLLWQDAAIVEFDADVSGEHLRVSRTLIESAAQFLDFGTIDANAGGDDLLAIDRLRARIQLTKDGLTITGNFGNDLALPPGCIAATGGRPIITQGRPLYPAAWVQFTEGPAASWVPATPRAIERAARLPLAGADAGQLQ